MKELIMKPIGVIRQKGNTASIELYPDYRKGLLALAGFSHLNLLYWFHHNDVPECRSMLSFPKPYKTAPKEMGVFATRAPVRPNPVALTAVCILSIDLDNGIVNIPYTDALDGSPVIDLKPYTPSLDRVCNPKVPEWCSHWPESLEASADFPWEEEISF